jgi:hypothetical protein
MMISHPLLIFILCHFLDALYYMLMSSFHIVFPHFICLALSHMLTHLYYIHRFFCMSYSMSLLSSHSISFYWVLFALICCFHGKGLLNKCCCRINPKVIQMKASRKAGRSWVPNTFPRTYLSSGPSPRLVPLCINSKLVPGPKNQVTTHFLRPNS